LPGAEHDFGSFHQTGGTVVRFKCIDGSNVLLRGKKEFDTFKIELPGLRNRSKIFQKG